MDKNPVSSEFSFSAYLVLFLLKSFELMKETYYELHNM